ncbi:MAG: thiamine pyrophosphate-dependent dehydrogenase E1 component subunit alpha, partial [Rhodospirillaceae bacterium]
GQGATPPRPAEDSAGAPTGMRRRSFIKALGGVAGGVALMANAERAKASSGWSYGLDDIPDTKLVDMYDKMLKIRWWEEGIKDAFLAGEDDLYGVVHLYIGQEAVACGSIGALNDDDFIASHHRGHGHLIAKGGDLNKMSAEIFFRETGYNRGYGGSMHITDMSKGILGMNGIVGVSHMLAAGAAHGIKVRGTNQVSVAYGGDGSVNNGWFYGALRNAALYKLPYISIVENNGFQVSIPAVETTPVQDLSKLAEGLDVPGFTVDGQDTLAMYSVMKQAVDRARAGEGPTLIEAKTYRFYDHAGLSGAKSGVLGAFGLPYRSDKDLMSWIANDPLPKFRNTLVSIGVLTSEQADQMEADVKKQVADSIEFARQSPKPTQEMGLSN